MSDTRPEHSQQPEPAAQPSPVSGADTRRAAQVPGAPAETATPLQGSPRTASAQPFALITHAPIDERAVRAAVDSPDCGAVVMFHGIIRNHDGGEAVDSLDYSSHPEAQRFIEQIVADEQARTGMRLAAVHRVGSLGIGDAALIAAAAAPHRQEAFEAIEQLVERIKHEVPIWKRQHYSDGDSGWVGL